MFQAQAANVQTESCLSCRRCAKKKRFSLLLAATNAGSSAPATATPFTVRQPQKKLNQRCRSHLQPSPAQTSFVPRLTDTSAKLGFAEVLRYKTPSNSWKDCLFFFFLWKHLSQFCFFLRSTNSPPGQRWCAAASLGPQLEWPRSPPSHRWIGWGGWSGDRTASFLSRQQIVSQLISRWSNCVKIIKDHWDQSKTETLLCTVWILRLSMQSVYPVHTLGILPSIAILYQYNREAKFQQEKNNICLEFFSNLTHPHSPTPWFSFGAFLARVWVLKMQRAWYLSGFSACCSFPVVEVPPFSLVTSQGQPAGKDCHLETTLTSHESHPFSRGHAALRVLRLVSQRGQICLPLEHRKSSDFFRCESEGPVSYESGFQPIN